MKRTYAVELCNLNSVDSTTFNLQEINCDGIPYNKYRASSNFFFVNFNYTLNEVNFTDTMTNSSSNIAEVY